MTSERHVRNSLTGDRTVAVQASVVHGGVHITMHDGSRPVPRQLPAGVRELFGREALLARLDELQPNGLAALSGMAGVGKTALVLHWASGAAHKFPDGQLYVDLHGFGGGEPLRPQDALAGFLRALGYSRPEELVTLEERAAHFRTLMSGRRALVVLDNALSADHVRPLLPGPAGGTVIVISRHHLSGLVVRHAATAIRVDPLEERAGLGLLRTAVGDRSHHPAAGALVRLCAGLPLALRIVSERITRSASADLDGVVAELADEQARLDVLDTQDDARSAVRTVFSWSCRALPDHEADAFRLLGSHPGPEFGQNAVAALLDIPPATAANLLRSLTRKHLLLDLGSGRFGWHDLLRTYARELSNRTGTAVDRQAAVARLFDHYLHSTDLAGRIVMPHRLRFSLEGRPVTLPDLRSRDDALQWLDLERRNLEAMCAVDDPAFDGRRWQLAYTLRDYYFLTKAREGWLSTHEKALAACVRAGDPLAEARTRNNLGMVLVEMGELDEGAKHYRRARELFEGLGDGHGRSNALVNEAAVLRRRGDFAAALRNQELALKWYRDNGAHRNIGITLRNKALVEMKLAHFSDAVEHVEEAIDIALGLDLELDAAEGFGRLGRIHQRAGDRPLAEIAFRRAVHHARCCGSKHEEARALQELGVLAASTGRFEEARDFWSAALNLYGRLGSTEGGAVAMALAQLDADH
ncbi:tetratricopeptide (TPR) repeat protein [Saccharothrix tamanrassetensis]|uniref:Tetratricopeptide (TPR) repeat protein n=2 Tax=Saccharothrix tamanrassetensis TaxID=1051531 RepID=A0A841CZK9_9PSEU|nr:tetratricopeptide (TPR) repeat protein [Saccharothrix tamanrassetensis]